MGRRPTTLLTLHTAAWIVLFCAGCFPPGTETGSDGGTSGVFTAPTLEVTVSGVHFGPMTPDAGGYVDVVTTRDGGGKPTAASFRLSASIGQTGCNLALDRFGGDNPTIGVGQYLVESMQGASTLDGTVYPTTAQRISTTEGGAGCTGTGCDGAAFVLSALDAQHAAGYFMGNVVADSGAGGASVICTFWLKTRTYSP
jgi:hypothetical protein